MDQKIAASENKQESKLEEMTQKIMAEVAAAYGAPSAHGGGSGSSTASGATRFSGASRTPNPTSNGFASRSNFTLTSVHIGGLITKWANRLDEGFNPATMSRGWFGRGWWCYCKIVDTVATQSGAPLLQLAWCLV